MRVPWQWSERKGEGERSSSAAGEARPLERFVGPPLDPSAPHHVQHKLEHLRFPMRFREVSFANLCIPLPVIVNLTTFF